MPNFFVSSTSLDLWEYRQAAREVINSYKGVPLAMEYFYGNRDNPEILCEKEVSECDIFIGIYAHRYGSEPPGKDKSFTQIEYELAKKKSKECLCFIVEETHPWNPKYIEHDKKDKLNQFLSRIKKEKTVAFFTSPDDFYKKLSISIGKHLIDFEKKSSGKKNIIDNEDLIPTAPIPYIANSYPIPINFIGREEEKRKLSEWFIQTAEPVMVIESIGGMGKSTLIWSWLEESIIKNRDGLDGIFCWSFYNSPFEDFLRHLCKYVRIIENLNTPVLDLNKLHSILFGKKFLLILDGFERLLEFYAGMNDIYYSEKKLNKYTDDAKNKSPREPHDPKIKQFLNNLVSGKSKVLITTRLCPTPLEKVKGVNLHKLKGLSYSDAVHFFQMEGIEVPIKNFKRVAESHDYCPLILKVLAAAVKKSRKQHILQINPFNEEEALDILTKCFDLLPKQEKTVASHISVFRGAFSIENVLALFPREKEDFLWGTLHYLKEIGFLLYNDKTEQFDFHPIMRSFLYENLKQKEEVHRQAANYFNDHIKEIDVTQMIELYYQLVRGKRCDEAFDLFHSVIQNKIVYQLSDSAYRLQIDLLTSLFLDEDNFLLNLDKRSSQSKTLNDLAELYALSGQPLKSLSFFKQSISLEDEENKDKKNNKDISAGLEKLVSIAQSYTGQIYASVVHLRKSISLAKEINDEFQEAAAYKELERIAAYRAPSWIPTPDILDFPSPIISEAELTNSTNYWLQNKDFHRLSLYKGNDSIKALLYAKAYRLSPGYEDQQYDFIIQSMEYALEALMYANDMAVSAYPDIRTFIRAYRLLGNAIIEFMSIQSECKKEFTIPFFDEHFEEKKEDVVFKNGNEWLAAQHCLNEALNWCRKINLLEEEPEILLSQARLAWEKNRVKALVEIEGYLNESFQIAENAGYRFTLADIHLLCAQILKAGISDKLLQLTAIEHLQKSKEYALDISKFSDLYDSPDHHFYDGIPGHDILKQGMTELERIQNGYWVTYRMAEELEAMVR